MDYGRRVQFGYFIIPDATQPMRALEQAISAEEAGIDLFWPAIKSMGGPARTAGESVSVLDGGGHRGDPPVLDWWARKFDGRFYQLAGLNAGPPPAHAIGIWLGAYKPRMLALTGRTADGWVPSLGYVKPDDMDEANARIDDAARAAGRDPSAIRRLLNVGGDLTAEDFVTLVLEHGFDTFITSPDAGEAFIEEVVPKVRELVAAGRGPG